MSKYEPLWRFVADANFPLRMDFGEIERILRFPIDHSFLKFKSECVSYGFRVERISLKEKNVLFVKDDGNTPR